MNWYEGKKYIIGTGPSGGLCYDFDMKIIVLDVESGELASVYPYELANDYPEEFDNANMP